MSGGRRTYWPRAIALAALVLSCLADSPSARAGSGGPLPSTGPGAAVVRASRPGGCPGAGVESGCESPAAEEESRRGDDLETEIVLDTAPAAVDAAASGARADAARADRRPYLLTAHLRF